MVENVISSIDKTQFCRAHLGTFESDLSIFEVKLVKFSDYNHYLDIQHEINLPIKEYIEEIGIALASLQRKIIVTDRAQHRPGGVMVLKRKRKRGQVYSNGHPNFTGQAVFCSIRCFFQALNLN